MLQASGIFKSYGQLRVLKGIDVEIKKGEIVAIVGASGAGKSTLLHILGTLDTPDSGKLIIEGKDVFSHSANAIAAFRNNPLALFFNSITSFRNLLLSKML